MKYPLIILAAGKSKRMGYPKGLVKFQDSTLLEFQLKTFFGCGGKQALVVLGCHVEEYIKEFSWVNEAIKDWTTVLDGSVKILINMDYERGQFSSLKVGLREILKQKLTGVFVLPIDVPTGDFSTFKLLSGNLEGSIEACIPTFDDVGGHPVLLSRNFLTHLVSVDLNQLDARLDIQIKKLPRERIKRVPVSDQRIVLNINNPDDLAEIF